MEGIRNVTISFTFTFVKLQTRALDETAFFWRDDDISKTSISIFTSSILVVRRMATRNKTESFSFDKT